MSTALRPHTEQRRAVRRPKTVCPVVEERICPGNGCANPRLRGDSRCDHAFKCALWEYTDLHHKEGLPRLDNLRETPDGEAWLLAFPQRPETIADLCALIPKLDRCCYPERGEWRVSKKHSILLEAVFADFPDWAIARLRGRAP